MGMDLKNAKTRLELQFWEETLRLNRKSSLLSVALTFVILGFHNGLNFSWPPFDTVVMALVLIIIGLLRYFLAVALSRNETPRSILAHFFRLQTILHAVAWGLFTNLLSAWETDSTSKILLGALLMAGIPASATSSLGLATGTHFFYLIGYFGTVLGHIIWSGFHVKYPYLIPIAICYIIYLVISAQNQRLAKKTIFEARDGVFQKNYELQNMIDMLPASIAIIDPKGRYAFVNRAFVEMTGYTKEFVLKKNLGSIDADSATSQLIQDFISSKQANQTLEVDLSKPDRAKHLLVFLKHTDDGSCIVASFDITERAKLEKEAAQKKFESEEMQRLASLGQLASGIAHEIDTPLALIATYASQISIELSKTELSREDLQDQTLKINESLNRIQRIIKSMKTLSRRSKEKIQDDESFRIGDVMDSTLGLVWERFNAAGVKLELHCNKPELLCSGSVIWICQILSNLLNNALDAVASKDNAWVNIHVTEKDSMVECQVVDSGKGISEELQKRIFEPYFTTKAPGKGTGLGLSISKDLAQRMGGDLVYQSTLDGHTAFVLRLKKLSAEAIEIANSA
jgi:PAS domain S-box-containing protein